MYCTSTRFIGASLLVLCFCSIIGQAVACGAPSGLGSWSSTYGATLTSDIVVTTPLLVDVVNINAQGITIGQGGMLYFDETKSSITITANYISIQSGGSLWIGTEACPYNSRVTITLSNTLLGNADPTYGGNFIGIGAGGVLELHGAKALGNAWTKLTQNAAVGATTIQVLNAATGWQAGDKMVIATTDYSPIQSEVVTITSVGGNSISFVPALQFNHFGTITQNIDERAEVGLLTRNILIQGKAQGSYYGGHLMATKGFAEVHIEGVEFNNMGQDLLGRYPVHFHMCGDVPVGTYVRYNSIHDTNFRCVTIHATNGVLIQGNVAYNNYGHCYFLEDGVEVNNTFDGNLAILTNPKNFGQHIGSDITGTGLSSYWITNPQNTFTNNVAVGSYTNGFWFITRLGARGTSACLPQFQNLGYFVSNLPLGTFSGNTAHACDFGLGIESTNWDANDVPAQACDTPVANWEPHNHDGSIATSYFMGLTAHHCRQRAVWARMPNIILDGARLADNYESLEFATSGDQPPYASVQIVQNSIVVGFSDNKGNNDPASAFWQIWDSNLKSTIPAQAAVTPINGMKMYDGAQVIYNTVFQSFPTTPGRPIDSPLGGRLADQSQVATTNYVQNVQFIGVGARYNVIDNTLDGGITGNFRDTDGSVTGFAGSTALRDFPYYRTSFCQESSLYMLACPHRYAQMWVLDMTANGNNNDMIITRSHQPVGAVASSYALTFLGFSSGPVYRYQPLVAIGSSYLVRFQSIVSPSLVFQLNNAELNDNVGVAVCYPTGTIILSVQTGYVNYPGGPYPSTNPQSMLTSIPASLASPSSTGNSGYYYDAVHSILYVNLRQRNVRTQYGNFCPNQGCDMVWINAQFPNGAAARDCTADAYSSGFLQTSSPYLSQQLVAATTVPNVLPGILANIPVTPITGVAPPTQAPTAAPTVKPPVTSAPTAAPAVTPAPTSAPTAVPTAAPTAAPTTAATSAPTAAPTAAPTPSQCTTTCPSTLSCCGGSCYLPSMYVCNNGLLCQKGYSSCGNMCYPPTQYACVNNALQPL